MKLTETQLKELVGQLDEMNVAASKMSDLDWKNLHALLSFPNARQVLERCPNPGYKLIGLALLNKGKV